jgi:hypothetical protein
MPVKGWVTKYVAAGFGSHALRGIDDLETLRLPDKEVEARIA